VALDISNRLWALMGAVSDILYEIITLLAMLKKTARVHNDGLKY